MLWLTKPRYLRGIAALVLVGLSLIWDLSERSTEPYPHAASAIHKGDSFTSENIVWRDLPVGSLAMPDLSGGLATTDIHSGDPITPSLVSNTTQLPEDSWALPLPIPTTARSGYLVRIVFSDGSWTTGVVIQPSREDTLGLLSEGLVAVSGSVANTVALAAANNDITVLIEP